MRQANGLASQVTKPHTNALPPVGTHWSPDVHSPVDSEDDFIAHIAEAAAT